MILILHHISVMTDTRDTIADAAGHPTSSAIAAFVDRSVHGAERDALLAHFASCAECRREMTDVRAAVAKSGSRQYGAVGMRARWPVALAGIAALLLVAIVLPRTSRLPDDGVPVTRTPDVEPLTDAATLAIVAPVEGDTLTADRTLSWHSGGTDATYLVTVQDSTGSAVWSASLADTNIVLPDSARLVTGARYFWSVDVRRADGSASRSGVHRFVAR